MTLLLFAGCAATERKRTEARAEELLTHAPKRTGDLELHCVPDDAQVEVDGVPQGTCSDFDGDPRSLQLGKGMHRVVVNKPGFRPYETYYQPSGAKAVLRIALSSQQQSEGVGP